MRWLLIAIALLAGTLNAIEAGTNTALRKALGTPAWSVAVISLVALVASATVALATGERWPGLRQIAAVPWWGWTGGILGLGFVLAMVVTAETLGTALFIALTVTAATVSSILIDHFGWIGMDAHPASIARVIGGLLMVAGVALIAAS